MPKKLTSAIVPLFTILFIGGIVPDLQALQPITRATTVEKVHRVETFARIADNVIILFDSSGSMATPFSDSGMTELQAAKKILKERTETLPESIPDLNIGLYSYTPAAKGSAGPKEFEIYKVQPFNKTSFMSAVDQLPEEASGPTLMVNAFRRLGSILDNLSGRSVVFLFTDGTHSDQGATEGPLELAKKIAAKHDVNFQIINTSDATTHTKIMQAVASINESSRVHTFESLVNRPEVYLGAVFAMEEDYITSAESRNEIVGFKLDHILFGFDKMDIEVEFNEELDTVGEILQQNPGSYIVLAGHTDNTGSEEYNLALSHQRVEAVGSYLADKFNIEMNRMELFWYGEAAPITSNDTDEGRHKNRRVVGFIAGIN
jgi:outer membrane protein OmpA-like peptidoglycan-associated protein